VNGYQNTANPETIYIRAENIETGCANTVDIPSLRIFINEPLNIASPTPYEICNPDGSGIATFSLTSKNAEIINGLDNVSVSYHATQADADNDTNFMNVSYTNTTPFAETIYTRAENLITGCYATTTLDLIVTDNCLPSANLTVSYLCDDDDDGLIYFDLTSKTPEAINGYNPADVIVSFHLSSDDVYTNSNAIKSD
jgi:hypothetical protein